MNNPINGNRKVANGALDQLMFGSATTSCVNGSASSTIAAIPITQAFITGYQFNLRINTPADSRPIARQAAKMLVTCTLIAAGSMRISLLNVGSQVPTLCSISTYKNAVMTNTHTSGLKNSCSMAMKSSTRLRPAGSWAVRSSNGVDSTSTKVAAHRAASTQYTCSQLGE